MSVTNVFLDLLSSEPELRYYEHLRNEAAEAFKSEADWADLGSLAKLTLTDSTIRESLRRSPVSARAAMREVVHKDGVTLPSGDRLPRGALLGVSMIGVHTDDRFYTKPNEYDPFRFARPRNVTRPASDLEPTTSTKASETRSNVRLITPSDIFLGFGYGRHAW